MKKALVITIALVLTIASLTHAEKPPAVTMDQNAALLAAGNQGRPPDHSQRTILSSFMVEDFEGTFPPDGWTIETTVPGYTWAQDDYMYYQGQYSAYCPYNFDQNERFVSPVIDLTGAGADLRVEFWWQADYAWMVAPHNNGDYELWISIDGGDTWTEKLWDEESVGYFNFPSWYKSSVDLSAYIDQTNVKLSWLYVASDANDVFLDYVVITDDPLPPNDNCDEVTPVPLAADETITFTGDNSNATGDCDLIYYPEVWHAFTIDECLNVIIDFCGTDPAFGSAYTMLADECPCGNFISPLDYNNSDCGDDNWTMYFRGLLPGTYYYPVMYDPGSNTAGPYVLHVSATACPPQPENDNCADVTPEPLTIGSTLTFSGTNLGATNDCDILFQGQTWHAFSTTEAMDVKIDYCGTDPVFSSVFNGITDECPCGPFIYCFTMENTSCGDGNYAMYWYDLPPGDYYYPVMIDYWAGVEGPYTIHITGIESPPPPENDLCANALPIGAVQNMPFSNFRATIDELGDCISTKDIWYVFTAPITGSATVTTCGSNFNTKLAIYDGYGCDPLPELMTCDDDDWDNDCGYASRSIFDITEGNDYLIQVGGGDWDEIGDGVITVEYGNPVIDVDQTPISGQAPVGGTDSGTLYISNNGTATLHFDLGIEQNPYDRIGVSPHSAKEMSYDDFQAEDKDEMVRQSLSVRPGFKPPVDKAQYQRFLAPPKKKSGGTILEGGEDIGSAEPITTFPFTDYGSTDGRDDDYDEACMWESWAPDVVYSYSPTESGEISISLCGSDYDTKVFVYDNEFTPGSPYACNDDGCGTWGQRSLIPSMDVEVGHTYYIVVDGGWGSSGDYEIVLDEPIEPPANDDCADAIQVDGPFPATVYGNNLGASVDCPGWWDMYAVWYKVDVPYERNKLELDYCGTEGSISWAFNRIFADCNDCGSDIGSNSVEWNDCDNDESNPKLEWISLPGPATYYVPVNFGGETFDFALTVNVTEFIPCELDCPEGFVSEDEDCGDDNNGGCGDDENPGDFQDISDNMTICGSAWADDGSRDTDWYRLELDQPEIVTITGMAEFPFQMLIIEHNSDEPCDELETINGFQSDPCEEASMTSILHEGEWYIWAGPSEFENMPCDGEGFYFNEYYFTISGQLSWLSIGDYDGTIPPGESADPIEITMGAEALPEGDYTGNIFIYSDDPENSEISIPVSLNVSGISSFAYLAGDANMSNETVDVGNPLTGPWRVGGDVTFLVNYFDITSGNQPCLMYNAANTDDYPGGPVNGYYFASADATGEGLVTGGDVSRLVAYFGGTAEIKWYGWDKPDPENYYPPMWLNNRGSGLDQPVAELEDLPIGWPNCQIPEPAASKVIPGVSQGGQASPK